MATGLPSKSWRCALRTSLCFFFWIRSWDGARLHRGGFKGARGLRGPEFVAFLRLTSLGFSVYVSSWCRSPKPSERLLGLLFRGISVSTSALNTQSPPPPPPLGPRAKSPGARAHKDHSTSRLAESVPTTFKEALLGRAKGWSLGELLF